MELDKPSFGPVVKAYKFKVVGVILTPIQVKKGYTTSLASSNKSSHENRLQWYLWLAKTQDSYFS